MNKHVKWAKGLLYITLLTHACLTYDGFNLDEPNSILHLLGRIVGFFFTYLLVYQLGRKKNWVRVMLVFLFVIKVSFLPFSIVVLLQVKMNLNLWNFLAVNMIGIVAHATAAYMLCMPTTKRWFKRIDLVAEKP